MLSKAWAKVWLGAAVVAASCSMGAGVAHAEEKGRQPRGAITIVEINITAKVTRPFAVLDVMKLSPSLALSELRQPFLGRIEKSILQDPF
jgi:hypothetical protein